LKGKHILVTGASSGIGFEIAHDFLRKGGFVGAHYFSNRKEAEELLRFGSNGRCQLFQADFSRTEEVFRLWDEFMAWSGGRVDVLVNNAGEASQPLPLDQLTEEAWNRTFQINTKAPFLLSRAALAVMSKQCSGRIINISSVGVKFGGSPTTIHYSASKAALEAVTKSLAKAGAPHNVLVNVVQAGVTDTAFHNKIGRRDMSERIAMIPLNRMAHPSEISKVVLFLASEEGSYITGAVIPVAGGE
jgi:NAD(P)-dependent dehydrogenase (short-subunit alcohol dehydrogenase family)